MTRRQLNITLIISDNQSLNLNIDIQATSKEISDFIKKEVPTDDYIRDKLVEKILFEKNKRVKEIKESSENAVKRLYNSNCKKVKGKSTNKIDFSFKKNEVIKSLYTINKFYYGFEHSKENLIHPVIPANLNNNRALDTTEKQGKNFQIKNELFKFKQIQTDFLSNLSTYENDFLSTNTTNKNDKYSHIVSKVKELSRPNSCNPFSNDNSNILSKFLKSNNTNKENKLNKTFYKIKNFRKNLNSKYTYDLVSKDETNKSFSKSVKKIKKFNPQKLLTTSNENIYLFSDGKNKEEELNKNEKNKEKYNKLDSVYDNFDGFNDFSHFNNIINNLTSPFETLSKPFSPINHFRSLSPFSDTIKKNESIINNKKSKTKDKSAVTSFEKDEVKHLSSTDRLTQLSKQLEIIKTVNKSKEKYSNRNKPKKINKNIERISKTEKLIEKENKKIQGIIENTNMRTNILMNKTKSVIQNRLKSHFSTKARELYDLITKKCENFNDIINLPEQDVSSEFKQNVLFPILVNLHEGNLDFNFENFEKEYHSILSNAVL